MKKYSLLCLLLFPLMISAQSLTIEKIMKDPKWIGTSPSNPFWDADGKTLYFYWNPEGAPTDSIYYVTEKNKIPQKASLQEKRDLVSYRSLILNQNKSAAVYAKNGDVYYKDLKSNKIIPITQTIEYEYGPAFSFNDSKIVYTRDQNLYAWDIQTGATQQLTNFQKSKSTTPTISSQEKWLQDDQISYLEVLKERKEKKEASNNYNKNFTSNELRKIYTNNDRLQQLSISPDGRFISYMLSKPGPESKRTIIPDYVTESGFTTDIPGRTKVGSSQASTTFYLYDRHADTVFKINTDSLPGIRDLPDYVKDYPNKKWDKKIRPVYVAQSSWSPNGEHLVLDIRSDDFKDRWIVEWKKDNSLELINRQRDEAWIGGPGLGNLDWINNETIWFQTEETGYAHLYSYHLPGKTKRELTSGKYEVQQAQLSNDHQSFYIITNEVHPGEKQLYRLNIADGKKERLTFETGGYEFSISPDEKNIALIYSYTNKPGELYWKRNNSGNKPERITTLSQSNEFQSYSWRDPEVLSFTARDGAQVYARVYAPREVKKNMPAVIFVHGAGYLQNAHKWWSTYFREYMFHNFLADNGYYVMDIDYRGSAGYGRDWRTGIYRHMGGKDLTDNVDAANFLVKNYGVDASSIGIYGGSYGGFITLMAMFNTPDVFAAGAGLRSVTDWANYNHGYTARILNEPVNDSIAYHRSSPIYFAQGLKGHLLMCHGMVDVNVHFQDIVKLSQRLIELKKDNWELAVYPMEDHGFEEPTSWMDEYKRIFKLFETVLKKEK